MTLTEFLSDRLRRLILQAVFVMAGAAFLHATGTQTGILLLLLLVWFFALIGTQAVDFLKCRSRLSELESIMDGLDEKYLFAECIPTPQNAYERRLLFLFKRAGRSMIGAVSDAQTANREYRAYVESWVHEIKTPITAAELICRRTDKETGQKLSVELAQIKAHVERALFYARAESPEKDFLIRQISLSQLVGNAIDNHRSLLIQSGLRIETENLEQTVYTDEKWTVFILGQLLQNAARYRSERPLITFSADNSADRYSSRFRTTTSAFPPTNSPVSLNGASPEATDAAGAALPAWACIFAADSPHISNSSYRFPRKRKKAHR